MWKYIKNCLQEWAKIDATQTQSRTIAWTLAQTQAQILTWTQAKTLAKTLAWTQALTLAWTLAWAQAQTQAQTLAWTLTSALAWTLTQTLAQMENSITESDWLFPHHPIPNAKFPPITTLLNGCWS